MKKLRVVVFISSLVHLFISSFTLFSQTVTITLGNVSACKGDTISVPVNVKGFSNICAIGVRVTYDTTKLKYVNCVNINPAIPEAEYAKVRSYITLGWFSTNEKIIVNIKDNDKLFAIKFICLETAATGLKFENTGCVAEDCNIKELKINLQENTISQKEKCR